MDEFYNYDPDIIRASTSNKLSFADMQLEVRDKVKESSEKKSSGSRIIKRDSSIEEVIIPRANR